MESEEIVKLENRAKDWYDKTDIMQFTLPELLTMFAESELNKQESEINRLKEELKDERAKISKVLKVIEEIM